MNEKEIRGMVADLDAHSQYLDEAEYQDIRISTTGNYSGVGIEVSTLDGEIRVVAPIDDPGPRLAPDRAAHSCSRRDQPAPEPRPGPAAFRNRDPRARAAIGAR